MRASCKMKNFVQNRGKIAEMKDGTEIEFVLRFHREHHDRMALHQKIMQSHIEEVELTVQGVLPDKILDQIALGVHQFATGLLAGQGGNGRWHIGRNADCLCHRLAEFCGMGG